MPKESPVPKNMSKAFEAMAIQAGLDHHYDPGLDKFQKDVANAEKIIRNNPDSVDTGAIISELNERWPFHGATVVVSGKLYASSDDIIDAGIAEEYGPFESDGWGAYVNVNELPVVSMGVVEAGADGSDASESSLAYAYGLEIDDEEPLFIARLSDLHTTLYPYSTYEGSLAHLRHEFPAIYADIMRLVPSPVHDFNKLTNSLLYFVKNHPEICYDNQLRSWVSTVITRRANLDRNTTYSFTIEDIVLLLDDEGEPVDYSIAEPYGFDAFISAIGFGEMCINGRNTGTASYLAALPSGRSSKAEYVDAHAIIPADSVISLEPHRPMLSVREQLERAQYERITKAISAAGLTLIDAKPPEALESSDTEVLDGHMSRLEQCIDLQCRLDIMVDKAKKAARQTYPTEQFAGFAANQLLQELGAMLGESEISRLVPIEVSGAGVSVPTLKIERSTTDTDDTVTIRRSGGLKTPPVGVEIRGTINTLTAYVERLDDGAFRSTLYMSLSMRELSKEIDMATWGTLSLAQVGTGQAALVKLDGSATIELVGLKTLHRQHEVLKEFTFTCRKKGALTELAAISRLYQAIHRESDTKLISLRNMSLLHDIQRVMMHTEHVDAVADALSAVLSGSRLLSINGEFIDKEGTVLEAEDVGVTCIDVVHTIPLGNDRMPCLVVTPARTKAGEPETIYYAPLHSIASLRY